jgi:rhodanese-related sulfurtransferase
MKLRWFLVFVAAALALTAVVYADRWDLVKRQIDRKFPTVPKISTSELAALLNDPGAKKPVLFDVRTEAEFKISHLAGARRAEPKSDPSDLPRQKETPIVTYCSVGYRSAEVAERLRVAGYTNVRNLEGSIFQWANEGRPLVRGAGEPTDKVHPYSATWGTLLKKEHRANLPAAK